MKIIQVISSLGNGGAEKLIVELSNELSLNNQVTLVSIKKIKSWMFPPKYLSKRVELLGLGKKKGYDLRLFYKLFSLLRIQKPDIVHLHLNMPLYYFLLLIPLFRKIKFVFTIHNTFEPHKKLFKTLNKIPYYGAVANICLSHGIYSEFKAGFPKLNFFQIENGIKKIKSPGLIDTDLEKIIKDKNQFYSVFLFVGRFSHQKNIPLLLEVFLSNELNKTKLVIIGDGAEATKNSMLNLSLKTENRIEYLGKKENVLDYMRVADALILTSYHEGLPIVLLEALYVGLPIVSTPVGGVPDIVADGINGFLSEDISQSEITNAIKKMQTLDKKQVESIRLENKKLFNQKFSIEVCCSKHEKLYKQLLGI